MILRKTFTQTVDGTHMPSILYCAWEKNWQTFFNSKLHFEKPKFFSNFYLFPNMFQVTLVRTFVFSRTVFPHPTNQSCWMCIQIPKFFTKSLEKWKSSTEHLKSPNPFLNTPTDSLKVLWTTVCRTILCLDTREPSIVTKVMPSSSVWFHYKFSYLLPVYIDKCPPDFQSEPAKTNTYNFYRKNAFSEVPYSATWSNPSR